MTPTERKSLVELYGDKAQLYFYFSEARYLKSRASQKDRAYYNYRLYSNKNSFYRDRDKLIECGFIELAVSGKASVMFIIVVLIMIVVIKRWSFA